MKKIFSKFEKNEKIETPVNKESTSYVGKTFKVGKSSYNVIDILAEGKCERCCWLCFCFKIFINFNRKEKNKF